MHYSIYALKNLDKYINKPHNNNGQKIMPKLNNEKYSP